MENDILTILNQILAVVEAADKSWTQVWVPSIIAVVSIFITAILSYILGYHSQTKLADRKLKQQSYGNLMGYKQYLSQLLVSRFEAYMFSDYHEKRVLLLGANENSHEFNEAKRWMIKSEELVLEISKLQEKVFSTLGIINAVYKNTDELSNLVNNVYKFKKPNKPNIPNDIDLKSLETWITQTVIKLQKLVRQEISDPIDKLLTYLGKHV